MAVYSRLLLSTGGGIISNQQQANQTRDTATLLIGLGGTGVHCIRTIKSQVYSRLKPDDPEAIVPEYSHIRFLGVDTTEKSRGGALKENQANEKENANAIISLSDSEFFSLANKQVARAFSNTLALEKREELSWLNYENIKVPNLTDAGAGGIRQVGRFMMMDKSEVFMSRLEQEISAAKRGLVNPRVNIHIFTGLSGGTGSGCFLDVCYMVRSIAERIGGVTIFGYCFMPDVNLSVIPFENVNVRRYIPQNGYATMQEIDYCMNLQFNGGSFEQMYQGHKLIKWSAPPVDMCHLICATDKDNNEIPNAYNYAMNVTAEYVMDFLTDSDQEFGLSEHLSNFQSMVGQANAKKVIGSDMAYCVIGASCASVPLREINTYLASELFDKFSRICHNVPSQGDVEDLAIYSLARDAHSLSDIYESLFHEIQDGTTMDYNAYTDDWKFVRDYGNANMVTSYTNQTAAKKNKYAANGSSMVSEGNESSLIGRVRSVLSGILCDVDRGPIYAYRMISAAESHNLLNLINGLIAENTSRYDQEAAQNGLRMTDYENAKSDFENRRRRNLLDNDQKRFESYEYYLMLLEQHKATMDVYANMEKVLNTFKKQVLEAASGYYVRLARVTDTLVNTFEENRSALASDRATKGESSFTIPMMTIAELKKSLDEEIARINVPGMLEQFMHLLLNNEEEWILEDENRITKLVTKFFIETAFGGFANRTITAYLKSKYENQYGGKVTDEELTNYILRDWIKPLTEKASPLFYFNSSIWPESETSKLAFLSFPSSSAPIKNAAQDMHEAQQLWGLKESALTDRIFVMCSACGLPLSTYNNCVEYERMFFESGRMPGMHYYEGKPVEGLTFCDWNKLPSIMPQSVIHTDKAPVILAKAVEEARELFDEAYDLKLIDSNGVCYEASQKSLDAIDTATESIGKVIQRVTKAEDVPPLANAMKDMKENAKIELQKIPFSLPSDGYRRNEEMIKSVLKDHFVSSPAVHEAIRKNVETVKAAQKKLDKAEAEANEKAKTLRVKVNQLGAYCDALFAGVISIEGRMVIYHQNEYGIVTDHLLSQRSEEFKYGLIPVYQGFLSYQDLDESLIAEIKKETQKRFNADDPVLHETGLKLKTDLSDDKMSAAAQIAANFENRKEIVEFLGGLKQKFGVFCLENGI